MNKTLLILASVFLIASCKPNQSSSINNAVQDVAKTSEVPPAIPTETLINLYENCDFIDFIFRDLPFSISQEDKPSIQATIRGIANVAPPSIDPTCPYFAQQIFQENGEIILDAKIFFQEGCTHYLFYEDGKAIYSGSFTEQGVLFYNNIIAQAEEARSNG